MRITYRHSENKQYWNKRWSDIPADNPMKNKNVYPLKYAEIAIQSVNTRILEAGCGAGRILRYYHDKGYNIIGIDFIEIAISKLKTIDKEIRAEVGDITKLQFDDGEFDCVLSFGLYHNLENDLDKALMETYRVLAPGGVVCASIRSDNLQTKLVDWLADRHGKRLGKSKGSFIP